MTELDTLIAEQARDMASNRVSSWHSVEAMGERLYAKPRARASDPRHGTENLYQRRCRCERCRAAHAEYRRDRRAAGKEATQ